ncbi:Metallo-dependent phosphatase-like protein [Podospora aff. communis PSN243]|uniref:Metallo-dependent phosphatase-like protein n=1 Tax=Podospora aff. communis PSN243 TaxID=3040156 RepID=A0AAV9GJY8_9PEZI|nr:Metallo-dependent phosphatase-like protein [Podospora aff. communis PSN243]
MALLRLFAVLLAAALSPIAAVTPIATRSELGREHLVSQRSLSKRFIDENGHYNLSFYHINDVHAHLDEFSSSGTDCSQKEKGCRGGYARVRQVLQDTRPDHPDSLFLNAGDEFQGTMFFTKYGGEKIAETLNQMDFDAMTLGNHEWDRGDEYLGEFLDNLTFPVISANVISKNPALNSTIKPFQIFEQYQLAVIGATTAETADISSVDRDVTSFADVTKSVQDAIDLIRSTTNITRIVALTHIGYEEDMRLAQETTGLHLIIGGHSHTKLGSAEDAEGSYPTIVKNKDGEEVFVVTAWRWGEYLGYIDVTYDHDGRILEYHGAPIHLTNQTKQEPELQRQIDQWRAPFEEEMARVVGHSNVVLDQTTCQLQECLLGDFIADAMVASRPKSNTPTFALMNAGGVRATIDAGEITLGEVLTAFPFGNSIVEIMISGEQLWTTLEGIVSKVSQVNGKPITSFVQVSREMIIEYDPTADVGKRLLSVTIEDAPLDRSIQYRMITIDFIAKGGDNFFSPAFPTPTTLKLLDEALVDHIVALSPIDAALDGRIKTGKRTKCKRGGQRAGTRRKARHQQ